MKRFVTALSCAAAVVMGSPAFALEVGPPSVPGASAPAPVNDATALLERLGLGLPPGPAIPPVLDPGTASGRAAGPMRVRPNSAMSPSGEDPFPGLGQDAYAAYGTGTVFSSDAELSGVGVAIEKAFSSAVYGSKSLPARTNEIQRPTTPALDAGHGFGAASAADIGEGDDRVDLPDDISASAPPNKDEARGEVADVALLPLLHADLLRTRAGARTAGDGCVIGRDLASGQAMALRSDVPGEQGDAERPVLTLSDDDPARALTESRSRVGLLPPASKDTARFGIFSETRQTIAPVTFLKGTPNEVTVELAGEWVLRVMTDGRTANVSYGPDVDDRLTPVLRIDRPGDDADVVLTAQDLAGSDGENISTPGVEEFIIAEPPRVIGGATGSAPLATATRVSAAVDAVRLLIPDDRKADGLIDVVVGHMEAAVALPSGGITCPGIAMAKEASSAVVRPGDEVTWTVTVANPNDCVLERVTVVDTVGTKGGLRYEVTGTSPTPTSRDGDTLTFSGFKPLRMGEAFTVTVKAKVASDSGAGNFTNDVVSAGACGPAESGRKGSDDDGPGRGEGGRGPETDPPVILTGKVSLAAPAVTGLDRTLLSPRIPASSASSGAVADGRVTDRRLAFPKPARPSAAAGRRPSGLARTGGWIAFGPGLGLLAGGIFLRRSAARRS